MCFPDDVLRNVSKTEHYCYPSSLVVNIIEAQWFYRTYVILLGILITIIVFVILFCIILCCHKLELRSRRAKSIYSKLSMSELQAADKKELMTGLDDGSDSD